MKITAKELYAKLVDDYQLIGQKGNIVFTLKGLSVEVKTKDTIGNLLQEWLKHWFITTGIEFKESANTQSFPDFHLDINNEQKGLLEVKTFDWDRGPGFDLANFDAYCNSLTTDAYRLDSDYLIFAYQMKEGSISIKNIWLKKIWEMACPSGTYPLKVQEKKNVIYNIRPSTWYSARAKYTPFSSLEDFLSALNETRYQYPQTRHSNAHWLKKVLQNYEASTGLKLSVK